MSSDAPMQGQHVCVLSTVHAIDDVRVNAKMVQSFLAAGARVTWVGPDYAAFDSGFQDSRITYRLTRRSHSLAGRLWSLRRLTRVARSVPRVDWFYAPTPDAARIAQRVAKRTKASVQFDLLEAYHKGLLDRHLKGREIRWLRAFVRRRIVRICENSDLVSTVSQGVLDHYRSPETTYVIVRSCAPVSFSSDVTAGARPQDLVRFLHGKVSPINGTQTVLDAVAMLPAGSSCQIMMFGEVAEYTNLEQSQSKLALRPPVPHSQMPAMMRTCSVGIIAYPRNLGVESLPNRLFEYMATGMAIIAPDYSPEIRNILVAEECGITIDTEDPRAIADALVWATENSEAIELMGQRASAAFALRHNWEREFQNLLTAMRRVRVHPISENEQG